MGLITGKRPPAHIDMDTLEQYIQSVSKYYAVNCLRYKKNRLHHTVGTQFLHAEVVVV